MAVVVGLGVRGWDGGCWGGGGDRIRLNSRLAEQSRTEGTLELDERSCVRAMDPPSARGTSVCSPCAQISFYGKHLSDCCPGVAFRIAH